MGNVYMEADQVRFKSSSYRDVQAALAAALEGGGGGGTTVIANPEGEATADLSKLQVGDNIYGIPAEAGDISYDNTSSGMTADDVQEAIDELNTGLSGVTELIPSGATSSNKLATADDIPGAATVSAPGIVQPDGTTITIADGVISAVGGGGAIAYSTSEVQTSDTWIDNKPIYRKVVDFGALPNATTKDVSMGITGSVDSIVKFNVLASVAVGGGKYYIPIPFVSLASDGNIRTLIDTSNAVVTIATDNDRSAWSALVILEYTKVS